MPRDGRDFRMEQSCGTVLKSGRVLLGWASPEDIHLRLPSCKIGSYFCRHYFPRPSAADFDSTQGLVQSLSSPMV